jgi:predicted peptidase
MRLAVDANFNLRKLFNVDGRRVYVSGFSGGSRVASMLGVCFGEMFSGTVCFMGVNFYTDIPMGADKAYPPGYIPDDQVLPLAKKFCRYVLVTGTKEMNHAETLSTFENGFRTEGFASVKLLDVPDQKHTPPAAEWLGRAIEFLDEGKGGVGK